MYAIAQASARTIPIGATSTPEPATTTTAAPPIASTSAAINGPAGTRRSSAIDASITHTGYV